MKKRGMNKTNLFFLECIVSIVMFAWVSLIILQAFMKVEETRIQSQEEMQALVIMCTIAEYIQAEKVEMPAYSSWYYNGSGYVLEEGEVPHFQVELNKTEIPYESGVLQNYELKTYGILQSEKQLLGNIRFASYNPQEVYLTEGSEGLEN